MLDPFIEPSLLISENRLSDRFSYDPAQINDTQFTFERRHEPDKEEAWRDSGKIVMIESGKSSEVLFPLQSKIYDKNSSVTSSVVIKEEVLEA